MNSPHCDCQEDSTLWLSGIVNIAIVRNTQDCVPLYGCYSVTARHPNINTTIIWKLILQDNPVKSRSRNVPSQCPPSVLSNRDWMADPVAESRKTAIHKLEQTYKITWQIIYFPSTISEVKQFNQFCCNAPFQRCQTGLICLFERHWSNINVMDHGSHHQTLIKIEFTSLHLVQIGIKPRKATATS